LSLGRRFAWIAIASLAGCLLLGGAAADTGDGLKAEPKKSTLVVRYRQSLVPTKARPRPALLPQTRYTVRKQIESIEPVSWLERFGKVQVRELEH
jgi:hypothetical protein